MEINPDERGKESFLYARSRMGNGSPYGLAIGYRVRPKLPEEKPGDTIQIEVVPHSDRLDIVSLLREELQVENIIFFE
jgi:hypothetical protein